MEPGEPPHFVLERGCADRRLERGCWRRERACRAPFEPFEPRCRGDSWSFQPP